MRTGTAAWLTLGILALIVVAYFGFAAISGLVAPLVVSIVMGMLFFPLVDRLEGVGLRRSLGAAAVLLLLVAIGTVVLWLGVRGVIDQGPEILATMEEGWLRIQDAAMDYGWDLTSLESIWESLSGSFGGGLGGLAASTFSGIASLFIGLFIGTFLLYYLLKDWHTISPWTASHMSVPQDLGTGLIDDATQSIRRYFYGLTMSSIAVAILIGLAMWALGLPLAFTIALVTFVTSYIPYLGAIFSGAFATLVALGSGGISQALIVLAVVLITQNVVQTVITTKLTSDQLQIHPIVNLGSTLIGASLAGILGATLSAPIVAMFIAARERLVAYQWGTSDDDDGTPWGRSEAQAQAQAQSRRKTRPPE